MYRLRNVTFYHCTYNPYNIENLQCSDWLDSLTREHSSLKNCRYWPLRERLDVYIDEQVLGPTFRHISQKLGRHTTENIHHMLSTKVSHTCTEIHGGLEICSIPISAGYQILKLNTGHYILCISLHHVLNTKQASVLHRYSIFLLFMNPL